LDGELARMKVAFFKGRHPGMKGWLGVATKWWTSGPYSHCELVIGETPDGKAICWSSAYLDHGVRKTTLVLDAADWDVIDVPTTAAQEAAAVAWFEAHAGQPYDVLGLLQFVWRREEGDKRKWFCSESVAEALGFRESWRYDPNTFAAVLAHWGQWGELTVA
jgi:uncharacterized protein YycO